MSNFEKVFVNSVYAQQGKKDFIVTELDVNVDETIKFLQGIRDYAQSRNGVVRMTVLKSMKDSTKHYLQMVKWKAQKPEVKAVEQMPDRETEDDLPF